MLEIRNFTKCYKPGVPAVKDLSLRVHPGEICGFIGHNGAGKSTTLKAIAGILDFADGDIRIGGDSIRQDPVACKRRIAYVPDNPDLYEYVTGIRYLNFIADIYRVDGAARTASIQKYGEAFEMTAHLGEPIGGYSHGMKQKLSLMAALLHEPQLYILDEPFVGLDPKATFTIKEILREKCDAGAAVFFSTHVLEVAEKLCSHVAIIRGGELIAAGDTQSVIRDRSLEDVFLTLTEDD